MTKQNYSDEQILKAINQLKKRDFYNRRNRAKKDILVKKAREHGLKVTEKELKMYFEEKGWEYLG